MKREIMLNRILALMPFISLRNMRINNTTNKNNKMKTKKKTFPMRTTLLLLLMMLTSLSVWANETFTVDDLTYMVVSESSKTVNVRNYSGTMQENYNMVIPASVTNPNNSTLYTVIGIDSYAFMNMTNLTSVSIPASMTRINQQAFEGCTNLETVSIPEANGVTDVGGDAFSGTKWLNDQPNGVVYVGKVAYLGKNVSGDVSINDGAVSISDEAFLNCTGLTSVTIPNSVTYIGSSAFFGCTNLTSITIPNSVTYIGGSAFSGSGLTSITIPNGVTDIRYEAFKGCTSLTSVTIPNSVTFIDDDAFLNCTSLTSITIPASVQIIMSGAFYGCYNLKTVTIYAPSCFLINDDAFSGCNDDLQIYVFSDYVEDYQNDNWSNYYNAGKITVLTGGYCGATGHESDVLWTLTGTSPNYTLTISGMGDMTDYASEDNQPWKDYRSSITSIVIENGVTSIGDGAFAYCTGATITIPTSVTTLGDNPFNQVGCVVLSTPLVDGNDNSDIITKIKQAKTVTFTYKRTFSQGVASTVCLPFAHTPNGEGTYYTFTSIDKNASPWTVTMTSNTAASLEANKPYMFMPTSTGEVTFSGTAVFDLNLSSNTVEDPVITEGRWNLIGTYESRIWDGLNNTDEIGSVYGFAAQSYDGGSYNVSPGDFVKAASGASIAPFRAYLKYTTVGQQNASRRGAADNEALPSRMSVRLVDADGILTAIGTIDTKTGEVRFDSEGWYTLDGRRLNSAPSTSGIYIKNGKKVILKDSRSAFTKYND